MIIKKENKYAPHQVILKRVNKKQNFKLRSFRAARIDGCGPRAPKQQRTRGTQTPI